MSSQRSQLLSQMSSQRSSQGTKEDLETSVFYVVHFLLSEVRHKRKIKKDDIVNNALNKSARNFAAIMERVEYILLNIYGLKLLKHPHIDNAFIIVNKDSKIFSELCAEIYDIEDKVEDVVLNIVLGAILMNGGTMFESHLINVLDTVGFLNDEFYPPDYEEMRPFTINLIKKKFVDQIYLETEVVPKPSKAVYPPLPEGEDNFTICRWGYRSFLEINIDKIVQFLSKIYKGRKPNGFPTVHYSELKQKQKDILQQAKC